METPQQQEVPFSEKHHEHLPPILLLLILILALLLGGLYLWGGLLRNEAENVRQERTIPNNEPETPRAEADQQILNTLSPSTEIDALYADLESTNLDSLDTELDQVTNEFKGIQ